MAKYLDSNGVLYLWTQIIARINTSASGKVDKVTGKALSTNDLTNELKASYDAAYTHSISTHAPATAEANIINIVKRNGISLTITDKAVDITVPTKTSELTNNSNFVVDSSYNHTDNNFSNADKTKLDGIAKDADVSAITAITVNGVTQTPTNKAIALTIPTKTSELTNNSNFVSDSAYVHTDANFTTALKTKLDALSTDTNANIIEVVKVNGTALTVTEKAVNVVVPTKLTDLTNDGNFVTDTAYNHTDNNYTLAEKNKLSGIAAGAEVNAISGVSVNGTALIIANKIANITVPTKISDLTNDGNFVTDASYVHTDANFTAAYKTKLDGIATGAEVNAISIIKVNGTAQPIASKTVSITVPTKTSQLTNDSNYLTAHQDITGKADKATTLSGYGITDAYTKTEVDSRITSTYRASGSLAYADLPTPAAANLGFVYNVSNGFTTDARFVEGAGKAYNAGTNVVIIQSGKSYLFDVLAGFVDLSGYVQTSDALTNAEIDALINSVA